MKLIDLNPKWVGSGGDGVTDASGQPVPRREGVAISFDCPCLECGERPCIPFTIGLDGQPYDENGWSRTGETFETLTLSPSLQRMDGCQWHGWLKNGELTVA